LITLENDFSVCRVNFRGVGKSDGEFDNGQGELSDAAAALDWIEKEKISKIINKINENLAQIEKIKNFHLVNENFSIENGMLTPTMKVKRNKVIAKYKNILENFYKK